MKLYQKDLELEKKFCKVIKAILGNFFISSDVEADRLTGTDFAIFTVSPFRVGVRLRRWKYLKYFDEFTIRWKRPSGVKTEIDKIKEGLVDYILYGFVNQEESKIIRYFIGDLKIFRQTNVSPVYIISNNPRDSDLAVYKINQFPASFVLHFWTREKKNIKQEPPS